MLERCICEAGSKQTEGVEDRDEVSKEGRVRLTEYNNVGPIY